MKAIKKIILAGDGGVGRTTLLHRYVEGIFVPNTRMTIGCEFFVKSLSIENKEAQLLFYDLSGQERFRFSQRPYLKGAHGAILTFDLTRPMTLDRLEEWERFLRTFDEELPILLVGLKTDLADSVVVDDEYALYFKDTLNLFDYIKASCRTGDNVELLFEVLVRKILDLPELPHPHPDPLEEYQRHMDQQDSNQKGLSPSVNESLAHFLHKKHIEMNQNDINNYLDVLNKKLYKFIKNNNNSQKSEIPLSKIIQYAFTNSNISISLSKISNSTESKELNEYLINKVDWENYTLEARELLEEKTRELFSPLLNTYKINEYLYLKYEHNKTNIYVEKKRFHQCKYLLMNINMDEREKYHDIDSIDEAAEALDSSLEYRSSSSYTIDPKTEFWGHCSNIEAWYENNYDTRILHRNLAFPLLRKLTEAGDQLAKRVFIEEIGRRFESAYPSVIHYLINEGYLEYLNKAELSALDISHIEYRNSSFWEKLIELYLSKKLISNALVAIRKIFKMNRNKKKIYKLLEQIAQYYLSEGLTDEATELFNFIIEHNPKKRIFIPKKVLGDNQLEIDLLEEDLHENIFFLTNHKQ
jgi:small GTP-binding protein